MNGNGHGSGSAGPPIISPKAEDPIDYVLILNLLTLLVAMREADDSEVGGAVLVFFSGFQEINELCKMIGTHPVLGDSNRVQAFPLHSSLPSDAQRAVFRRMPKGVTKVCLFLCVPSSSCLLSTWTDLTLGALPCFLLVCLYA